MSPDYLPHRNGAFVVGRGALPAGPLSTGGGDDGSGGGGGGTPGTTPTSSARDRAETIGINIQRTENVSSLSEIDGRDHTLYICEGDLGHAGKHSLGYLNHVAICNKAGKEAKFTVPSGFRDYSVTASGGSHFLWSGVDMDQSAQDAHAGININLSSEGYYQDFRLIGNGRLSSGPGGTAMTLHVPATDANGYIRVKGVELIYGGWYKSEHTGDIGSFAMQYGDAGNTHRGTMDLINCRIEEYPNNAIYASACPGRINAQACRLYNNGVTQFRVARGSIVGGVVGYDYNNTGMKNADAAGHGLNGIASEQKKGGIGGTLRIIQDVTLEMKNVAKGGQAIVTYNLHSDGDIGDIAGCDITVGNTDAQAAIQANYQGGSGTIDTVKNCAFHGISQANAIDANVGTVSGNTYD